jgi:hypothetical protein
MLDSARDNAIANHKTYGNVEAQHRLFGELRRDDPVHWTKPDGYRPFWTISKYADIIEIERQPDLAEEMVRWVSARRSKQATVFSSATRRVIATKTPSTVRSNSFPTGHPIGISASASEFMHASAGTQGRDRGILPRIAEPD